MKKFLLSLAAVCGLGFFANAGSVTLAVADATDIQGTDSSGNYQPLTSFVIGDYSFSFDTTNESASKTQMPTLWASDNTLRMYIGCRMKISGGNIANATQVVLTAKSLKGIADGAENLPTADGFTASYSSADKTITFDGTSTGDFVMTLPNQKVANANPNYQIQTITITYDEGGITKKAAGMSFDPASVSLTLGEDFTAPVLTKATNAAVVYESSNDDVASVDAATGDVRIEGIGTVTITATAAENDEYYGGTASYTINVMDPSVILSAAFGTDNAGFTFEDGTLPEGLSYVWTRDTKYSYMKASAYKSGAHAVEAAYLVSPVLDLAGRKNIKLVFNHAIGQTGEAERSPYFSLAVREEGGEWTKLTADFGLDQLVYPEGKNYTSFADSPAVDLSAYAEKKIQIGWCYTSTAEVAPTWEVKTVTVTGDRTSSAVEAVVAEDAAAPVEFFNLQGVRVANPENGLFIRRQGNKVEKVVIR